MEKFDFRFIKGLRFRTYLYGVMSAVIALLTSYHIIDSEQIPFWHLLSLAICGLSYAGGIHTLGKTKEIHKRVKEEHYDDLNGN